MSKTEKNPLLRLLEIAFIAAPWVIAMYVLYWLDTNQVWSIETAHRGKISVAILVAGLSLSFLIYSRLRSRKPA